MPLFSRPQALKVALVAGEASGDTLGAHLIEALRQQRPDIECVGIGGPKMEAQGLHSLYPQEALAVRGYAEVLRSLPRLLGIRRGLKKALLAEPPDVFIGIDAPDFNLGLEESLKDAGIPTVHYVSPSIWAWRPERIERIKRSVHHILALFPMEPPLYEKAGVAVTFVGHPLAQRFPDVPDRDAMRHRLQLATDSPVFAILPGSRISEIEYMGQLFLEAASLIHQALPEAQFLLPVATRPTLDRVQALLKEWKMESLPLRVLYGHAGDAMIAADAVLVASGTATLEVALAKRPMVISYRISTMTYHLVKHKLKLPYVGLPNILCGRFVVPELLQHEATPENLANMMLQHYADPLYRAWLEQEFTVLHRTLRADSALLAAQAVLQTVALHGGKQKKGNR